MTKSKHRSKKPGKARAVRVGADGGFPDLPDGIEVPSEEEIRSALAGIPGDMSWDWAEPRVVPLFERGYDEKTTPDQFVNTASPLGVGIGFGIEAGPLFARITTSMAERWETTVEQLEASAYANLARAAAALTPRDVQPAVHHGHLVRILPRPPGWASSIVLAGDETLRRLFGGHDQVFTVPARNMLVAFDARTPARAIVDVTIGLEELDLNPLMLEPFAFIDGHLTWEGLAPDPLDD